jgi:hypothetical protein
VGWANGQQLKEPLGRDGAGLAAVPATVPLPWPCRARAMSWARSAAHALHWPSGCAGTGTLQAVPCRPWAMPKGCAVGRAAGPWAVWKSIMGSSESVTYCAVVTGSTGI